MAPRSISAQLQGAGGLVNDITSSGSQHSHDEALGGDKTNSAISVVSGKYTVTVRKLLPSMVANTLRFWPWQAPTTVVSHSAPASGVLGVVRGKT